MPDINAIGNGSLLNAIGAGKLPLGGALGQFEQALRGALGSDATARFDQAVQGARETTTLRSTQGVVPPPTFAGPRGQVAALSSDVQTAVGDRLHQVEASQAEAQEKVRTLLSGGDVDMHSVILASERAKLELQLTMQLRNKLVEAYQEVMRTPI